MIGWRGSRKGHPRAREQDDALSRARLVALAQRLRKKAAEFRKGGGEIYRQA